MARTAGLNQPSRALLSLALVLALVLGGHVLVLRWLAGLAVQPTALRQLNEPMFTRLLQPQAPPPPPASQASQPPTRSGSRHIAIEPVAEAPRPAASAARRPEPKPDPAPPPPEQTVAQAPVTPEASEPPQAPASSPADTATSALPAAPSPPPTGADPATAATDPQAPPALASLDSWPRDTRVNYQLSGRFRSGDLYGGARVQWQRVGPLYQARVELDISLAGSRVLTSQGEVTPEGLLPDVFEETHGNSRRSVRMGKTTLVFNDGRIAQRPPGVQDSASQFVELSHRFATGRERLEVGRSVDIWLARPAAVDLWTYDIVGRERLQTPKLGEVEAFRLRPRPIANPRGNITAEIWFAPTLQYLPVRIRVSMGDEAHVDLMVDTIEQR